MYVGERGWIIRAVQRVCEMVFEKSTVTSRDFARVCIKRKSRSALYSRHHRPALSFPTFYPVFPFETPFLPIAACGRGAGSLAMHVPHFQFCINYFSRRFLPPSQSSTPGTNFEATYKRVLAHDTGSQILLFLPQHNGGFSSRQLILASNMKMEWNRRSYSSQ